jgi:hypothetical protein
MFLTVHCELFHRMKPKTKTKDDEPAMLKHERAVALLDTHFLTSCIIRVREVHADKSEKHPDDAEPVFMDISCFSRRQQPPFRLLLCVSQVFKHHPLQ